MTRHSLTLRVVAVALFCFVIATAFALFGTYRDVRQLNEHVADILVRQLQVQLSRIETGRDVTARFPDLDIDAERGGLELIGIRERVTALGGTLDVIGLGDKGFKLHAMIPFEAPVKLLQ